MRKDRLGTCLVFACLCFSVSVSIIIVGSFSRGNCESVLGDSCIDCSLALYYPSCINCNTCYCAREGCRFPDPIRLDLIVAGAVLGFVSICICTCLGLIISPFCEGREVDLERTPSTNQVNASSQRNTRNQRGSSSSSESNSTESNSTESNSTEMKTKETKDTNKDEDSTDSEDNDNDTELKKDIPQEQLCRVCFSREINAVLDPCGHELLCIRCAKKMTECPVCRKTVNKFIKVFRS